MTKARNEKQQLGSDQLHFQRALDQLLESDPAIQQNTHNLLFDLVHYKPSAFFECILSKRSSDGTEDTTCWTIDHLDDILDAKLETELQNLYREGLDYESAQLASMTDRSDIGNFSKDDSLVYGEVDGPTFFRILQTAIASYAPTMGGIFYDIGSGSGRAVMAARLAFDFDRCIGLEILPSLHKMARKIQERFQERLSQPQPQPQQQPNLPQISSETSKEEEESPPLKLTHTQLEFYCEDMLTFDFQWSETSVVFLHSTCFGLDLLFKIFEKAKALRSGALLITFRHCGIDSTCFELLLQDIRQASWGYADVFVYRRR